MTTSRTLMKQSKMMTVVRSSFKMTKSKILKPQIKSLPQATKIKKISPKIKMLKDQKMKNIVILKTTVLRRSLKLVMIKKMQKVQRLQITKMIKMLKRLSKLTRVMMTTNHWTTRSKITIRTIKTIMKNYQRKK